MNPTNIRLISAGAGTGKTFRLTDELSSLLTHGDPPYNPSQVIATTFTRAAAGELKNKIREKILERGEMQIIPQLEQALIGTVNSISQQLLTLFSFEAGLSPSLVVIDDEEKDVLFQTALSQSLDVQMLNEMEALTERFSIGRKDVRDVIKSISDNARNNSLGAKQLERSKDDSVASLKKVLPKPNKDQQKTIKALQIIIPGLRERVNAVDDGTRATVNSLGIFEAFHYKLQQGLANIPWAEWATGAKSAVGAKARDAQVFDEVIELMQAHMRFPEFQDDLFNYINLCFNVAGISMEAYAKLKKERGLVDFVDQESLLLSALDNPDIQKSFRERFKVLFVDEFQDTSPLQLSLFLKMASLVERVIWVGDSKQAIYGFRNSDAQLINTVTAALGKPNPTDILQTSYRSRPELVDIVNSLFAPAFMNPDKILSKEQVVLRAERKQNLSLQTAFQLWGFQWKPSPGQRDNNEKYQSHLAARVAAFLAGKPVMEDPVSKIIREVKAGDICILCRTNNNCAGIANALRNQGLQAVVSGTGLGLTAEWRLLKACLHLLIDATDSLSKSEIEFLISAKHDLPKMLEERLLFLNVAGVDYKKLNSWLDDHPIVRWIKENRSALLSESISGIIRLAYSGLNFDRIVMQWGNGAQRHANMQQVLFYSIEFEDYCAKTALLPNIHGFLSWFDALTENEEDTRGLVTNEFSVNVFTYHAAKGLEWPVVILCDMDYEREPDVFCVRVKAKDTIDFKDPLKDRSLRYWPWPYKTDFGKKNGHEEFKDCCNSSDEYIILEKKERTEALRLLYVGFTRARDYLILPFKIHCESEYLTPLVENGISSLIDLGNIETNAIIPRSKLFNQPLRLWVTNYTYPAEEINIREKDAEAYLHKTKAAYPLYFVNPSAGKPVEEVTFKEGETIHTSFSENKLDVERSDFGTFIHRVFCAYQPGLQADKATDLIKRLAANYGIDQPGLQKELLQRLPEFYQWIENEFHPIKIYKELSLMMETNGQLVDGIADLVIETADKIILIDYKTFTGDTAAVQWKATTFSGQLQLYMDILRKGFQGKEIHAGIYFVMKGIIVWTKDIKVEALS
jgi:ATP-dependent helicase/nuclease subunit A